MQQLRLLSTTCRRFLPAAAAECALKGSAGTRSPAGRETRALRRYSHSEVVVSSSTSSSMAARHQRGCLHARPGPCCSFDLHAHPLLACRRGAPEAPSIHCSRMMKAALGALLACLLLLSAPGAQGDEPAAQSTSACSSIAQPATPTAIILLTYLLHTPLPAASLAQARASQNLGAAATRSSAPATAPKPCSGTCSRCSARRRCRRATGS